MKKIYVLPILVCCLLCAVSLFAQQEPNFTHFMYNQQSINPAAVGSRSVPSITAIYRNQWLDIDGAPQSTNISISSPFSGQRAGWGLNATQMQVGLFTNWFASGAYSYKLNITEDMAVRIGLQAAAIYNNINFADPSVFVFDDGDPSIAVGDESTQLKGNFGAGAYFTAKNFYVGLSVPYFLTNDISLNGEATTAVAEKVAHFYGIAGAVFALNEKVKIRPSLLTKYVEGAPLQVDVNFSAIFSNKITAGISYRSGGSGQGESLDFLTFLQISNRVGIGVAYDFTLSEVQSFQNGTFELMMRIDLRVLRDDLEDPLKWLN